MRAAWWLPAVLVLVLLSACDNAAPPPPPRPPAAAFTAVGVRISGGVADAQAVLVVDGKGAWTYTDRQGRRAGTLTPPELLTLRERVGKIDWANTRAAYEKPNYPYALRVTLVVDVGGTVNTTAMTDPAPDRAADAPPPPVVNTIAFLRPLIEDRERMPGE